MDWKEKIEKAMIMLSEGCEEQTEWTKCKECPFIRFCDIIEEKLDIVPSEWKK